ncbi:MAG: hypothetical protein [Caudoviricetes sp.]|nr:MAG: hypothetical protein [Caudoviricetes sp.]
MKLEDIDTSTTAGERAEWLSSDDAQIALFQAIRDIKFGLPTDDKLILENLRSAGLWIARYQPEQSLPIGPEEVWVPVYGRNSISGSAYCEHGSAADHAFAMTSPGVSVRYIRADLAGEKD